MADARVKILTPPGEVRGLQVKKCSGGMRRIQADQTKSNQIKANRGILMKFAKPGSFGAGVAGIEDGHWNRTQSNQIKPFLSVIVDMVVKCVGPKPLLEFGRSVSD